MSPRAVSRDFDSPAEAQAFREGIQVARCVEATGRLIRNVRIYQHATKDGDKSFVSWDEEGGRP